MKNWFFDFFKFIALWFFYLLFFSMVLLIPFILISGNSEILTQEPNVNYFVILQIPTLIATILASKLISRDSFNNILALKANQIILGLWIGLLLISLFVVSQITLGTTLFFWNGFSFQLLVSALLYLFVAINEELLFRKIIFEHLLKKLEIKYSILITSVLFGLVHIGNSNFNLLGFINIGLFGALMSLYYSNSKNISIPIGVHFSWNFLQGPVFGFPVSGYNQYSLINNTSSDKYYYLSGGNFGAEGSLLLIPILIGFIIIQNYKLFKVHY